jgi:uncharacterized protein YndB with AHSA1/START domain
MADYERTTTVDAPAEDLFEYLSKVENLPNYMERMTSAHNLPGDEVEVEAKVEPGDAGSGGPQDGERAVAGDGWFRIDADTRTVLWGAEGPHDYHGQLQVTASGDAASTVTVRLHTTHETEAIQDGIDQTLANIQRLAGSEAALNPGAGTS